MKIRFRHPAPVRLEFQAGDEITVSRMTPELQQLLDAKRLDEEPIVEVVRGKGEEHAVKVPPHEETATTRGQARGQRSATVPE